MSYSGKNPFQDLSSALHDLDISISGAIKGFCPFAAITECTAFPLEHELRFNFVVSTLYKLYRETGAEDLKFLNTKIKTSSSLVVEHYELIHELRTFAQHDMSHHTSEADPRWNRCLHWYQKASNSGDVRKYTDTEWQLCITKILAEAISYLAVLKAYVDSLYGSAGDYVKAEWLLARTRTISVSQFDNLTREVAADLGMTTRDAVSFRNQNLERILKELRAQRSGINVIEFIKGRITARLIEEFPGLIVTADDLKGRGVQPGKKLGEVLKVSQQIWAESGYQKSKAQVLSAMEELRLIPTD